MSLVLHLWKSTVGLASHIALEESGLDYSLEWVDMPNAAQTKPAYRQINPKGRVPALVTERGVLTETPALLGYVAAMAPDAGLMPSDPFERARADEMIGYLAATVHVAHAHRMRASRWADDPAAQAAMVAKVPANMAECCAHLEACLVPGPFVLGERFSLADAHLFNICLWLAGDEMDIANYPRLVAHQAAMRARPAVARVAAQHEV